VIQWKFVAEDPALTPESVQTVHDRARRTAGSHPNESGPTRPVRNIRTKTYAKELTRLASPSLECISLPCAFPAELGSC
jgi:hypothetical protein